jgi:hypothetical protein
LFWAEQIFSAGPTLTKKRSVPAWKSVQQPESWIGCFGSTLIVRPPSGQAENELRRANLPTTTAEGTEAARALRR